MSALRAPGENGYPPLPTPDEMDRLFEECKNWGRWGEDDRGALALVTDDHRAAAASTLVRAGTAVSLAHDLGGGSGSEPRSSIEHVMITSGHDRAFPGLPGYEAARDSIGADVHGLDVTHVDALCHIFVRGEMFGGHPAALVTPTGARRNAVTAASDGIVGRGVVLDVPAARGVPYLEPDQPVVPGDLEAAERRQRSPVRAADILVVATGRDARRAATGTTLLDDRALAGLHPACLPWLRDRDVAVLGSDGISDPLPATLIDGWPFPIHQVAIAGLGMMLIDNLRLDDLLATCERLGRLEFLLTVAPLRIPGATGCPVNPIALL